MRPLLRRAAAAAKPPTAAQRRCFRYHLPQSSIAKYPASPRGSSRLLVAADGELTDSRFEALTSHLPRDALVIVNDSRVVRARLRCAGPDGAFEVLLLAPADADADPSPLVAARAEGQAWRAMLRRSDVAPGQTFAVDGDIHLRVAAVHSPWLEAGEADGVEADVAFGGCGARTLASLLDAHGTTPVPPYLDRPDDDGDDDAYQTAYAADAGSVAAPTAGLHFTDGHFAAVAAAFETHAVTLHVGAGTFRPVVGRVEDHAMHAERFAVSRACVEALAAAARDGRPVVAVGTTSARALESLVWLAPASTGASRAGADLGHLDQWSGRDARDVSLADAATSLLEATDATTFSASTSLCITPDGKWRFRAVDHLVTNFHHPDSTLLSLVAAFVGEEPAKDLYAHALAGGYRFLSYGDACYLSRAGGPSKKVAASSPKAAASSPKAASSSASSASSPASAASARKKRVLLHSCCAPCSGAMIEEMVETLDADVTVFFYNPNIHPRSEYELRKRENERYAAKLGIAFVDGDYDPDEWYRRARGLEYEPERGGRCTACFDVRMERTALYAHEWGFDAIATTNATSRWKDEAQVDGSGLRAAAKYDGLEYMYQDWKTDAMTERKYVINAEHAFYKQEYCGCSYSLRDNNFHRAKEGKPPIKPATADVYSDPRLDSEEESPDVVADFFERAPAFSEEVRAMYQARRRGRAGHKDNW